MFSVETTKGKYAVKALNPQIMLRPTAMKNIINSEIVAKIASNKISALPAIIFNGSSIQEVDGQFFLIFNWVKGKRLKAKEINNSHCIKIGETLANIHRTNFSQLEISNNSGHAAEDINWRYYLNMGEESNLEWTNILRENIINLYNWTIQANESAKLLSSNMIISHRDLDPKNVMWIEDTPIIIDWESAGFVNPMHELIETAIYWSESETGDINKDRFLEFIKAYKNIFGALHANWRMVLLNGFSGKLGWLEYSLKRSLGIECTDKEEQNLGTSQVIETINSIKHYSSMISEIEKWLNNELV
jgi:Ser/Thr protein kinase RdoA (MazF antagonist)